jgi:hypothetical protein
MDRVSTVFQSTTRSALFFTAPSFVFSLNHIITSFSLHEIDEIWSFDY